MLELMFASARYGSSPGGRKWRGDCSTPSFARPRLGILAVKWAAGGQRHSGSTPGGVQQDPP